MQRADHVPFCLIFPVLLTTAILFGLGCDDGDSGSSVDLLTQRQFDFTGEPEQFIVPAGVTLITVDAYGARGGDGWNVDNGGSVKGFGGLGGSVQATLAVTAGETLYLDVGGAGADAGEDTTTELGAAWPRLRKSSPVVTVKRESDALTIHLSYTKQPDETWRHRSGCRFKRSGDLVLAFHGMAVAFESLELSEPRLGLPGGSPVRSRWKAWTLLAKGETWVFGKDGQVQVRGR